MASWRRKCVFGCKKPRTLFSLPKDKAASLKWMDFIYGSAPQTSKQPFVCDLHFTEDCLVNLGQFQSGLSGRLTLGTGAIPTIKPPDASSCASSSAGVSSQQEYPQEPKTLLRPSGRSVGVQTNHSSAFTRTVATQLSMGTLKVQHVRSKGVQATFTTTETNTEDPQNRPDLPSTPLKVSTPLFGHRAAKRPRLEEEDEEEDISDITSCPFGDSATSTSSSSTSASSHVSEVIEKVPSLAEEVKYIVFESSLKEIFHVCPVCQRHCRVKRRRCGTFVSFSQKCVECQYSRSWQSGPRVGSTPLGNLQLSAAVYFTGGSFTNVSRIFNAMNLQMHKYNVFKKHSCCFLEPAIFHKWTEDRTLHLEDLKRKGKVALSGLMSADSPGRTATDGVYSLMDVHSGKVVDLALVQSSEVGGRSHMEKEGLCRCLESVEAKGVEVDYIVTDCHPQIQKYLEEKHITRFYNVSRVAKDLLKKLKKESKNNGCEVMIQKWFPIIRNHMFCTASSSTSGKEKLAKWASLIHSISLRNKDNLFRKSIPPQKMSGDPNNWDALPLDQVEKVLMNNKVLADVEKLSLCAQASSSESFRQVILHLAPNKSVYKYGGKLCRLYLAGMHQNERKNTVLKGKSVFKVSYSKFKIGLGTKKVKTKTTFGYVSALMRLLFTEVLQDPVPFMAQMKTFSMEKDLCEQFERAPIDDIYE